MNPDDDTDRNNGEDTTTLVAPLSTDGVFMRRACPTCGLHFKTEASPDQFSSILQPVFDRCARDYGLSGDVDNEVHEDTNHLECPYCGSVIRASEAHTAETFRYVHRIMYREVVLPMIRNAFKGFGSSRSSMVSFTYQKGALPPRPIHGPEPADMAVVDFLCCGKKAKLLDGWIGAVTCPFCRTFTVTW